MKTGLAWVLSLSCCLLTTIAVRAADEQTLTENGVIAGEMTVDFKTRTNLDKTGTFAEGSAAVGAQDVYQLSLRVAKTTEYAGKITRQPELVTKAIRSVKQKAQLGFDLNLAVRNPANPDEKKVIGKWVGTAPINPDTGVYDLAGGSEVQSPLRFAIDTAGKQQGFNDHFAGKLVGKAQKKDDLASYTYKRLIGTKTVEIVVKKVDPMKFEDLELAKGPSLNYPHTLVNGSLNYDYETGNWYTDNLKFKYNLNGKDTEDVVAGSIKWVEDENRKSTGKGYYDFNLRFNEGKSKPATTEAAVFEGLNDEEAFFAVDQSIPCLTGKIEYEDKFISGTDTPSSSKVKFSLNANKLTKTQLVNFFKLWMVCIGPTNDE